MAFGMGIIHDANLFEIVRHPWFISAFLAGGAAQLLKFVIGWWRNRRMDLSYLAGAGGMPSSHSALVSALATAVGLTEGFDAPDAMIAVGFALIVLCDAATLRRAAGEHAKLLNRLVEKVNDKAGARCWPAWCSAWPWRSSCARCGTSGRFRVSGFWFLVSGFWFLVVFQTKARS